MHSKQRQRESKALNPLIWKPSEKAVGDSRKSQDDLHAVTGFVAFRLGAVTFRLLHADMPGVCRSRTYRPG